MGYEETERNPNQDAWDSELLEIEARVVALEKRVGLYVDKESAIDDLPKDRIGVPPEDRFDRNHKQLMEALNKIQEHNRALILERLAKVESKLQHVA